MAFQVKEPMTAEEKENYHELVGAHHDEIIKKGHWPVRTDHVAKHTIVSHMSDDHRLMSHHNGKEIHHQWYDNEGVPVSSPKHPAAVKAEKEGHGRALAGGGWKGKNT